MFAEDDLLPISALQHLAFCPRQCALIHLEGLWSENRLTAEGRSMHEKAHDPKSESRPGVCITRSLRLHSFRLGLSGQADVVEFQRLPDESNGGIQLDGKTGRWQPTPVEYKRGSPKQNNCDIVQLCAQAICMEEMLQVRIDKGALFYGKPRRRHEVIFADAIRIETEGLAAQLHELMKSGRTPTARYEKKCESCSLLTQCMPKVTGAQKNVRRYVAEGWKIVEGVDP